MEDTICLVWTWWMEGGQHGGRKVIHSGDQPGFPGGSGKRKSTFMQDLFWKENSGFPLVVGERCGLSWDEGGGAQRRGCRG